MAASEESTILDLAEGEVSFSHRRFSIWQENVVHSAIDDSRFGLGLIQPLPQACGGHSLWRRPQLKSTPASGCKMDSGRRIKFLTPSDRLDLTRNGGFIQGSTILDLARKRGSFKNRQFSILP